MVRNSKVLAEVNNLLPDSAGSRLSSFNDVVGTTFFPRYLEPFAPERIVAVPPGPRRMLADPDVTRAERASYAYGAPTPCDQGIEGSGFVFAPDRVMTNAHVVAGVSDPVVDVDDSSVPRTSSTTTRIDVAVLALPTGSVRPLRLRDGATAGEGVAILGYPAERPLQRPGRPGARRPAAALARHLRRRHGDPRRAVAAWP